MSDPVVIHIPRDDTLIWCKRLYWMAKGHRQGGHKEAADVLEQLHDLFMKAAIEQLTPEEVERLSGEERVDTFPEFIDE